MTLSPAGQLHTIVSRLDYFTACFGQVNLRPYQVEAANAVIDSILNKDGDTFVWKFARQSGKDETLTALYQYLLTILAHRDASIIAAAPTYKPQTGLAMQRLDTRLSRHIVLQKEWRRSMRHVYRLRNARIHFYSAAPHANVVGATASPLLVINEAQDILPAVYDKRFAPMAAADNATRLFSGTAWTRDTLLAREERYCRQKEQEDGRKRVFIVDGPAVARVHPPYGEFLEGEMKRLGANHPIVLSQYLCQEIDSQSGMFNAARRALMAPDKSRIISPPILSEQSGDQMGGTAKGQEGLGGSAGRLPAAPASPGDMSRREHEGRVHAFLLDVAGQDENRIHDPEQILNNPGRDSVTLRIVEIDLSTLPTLQSPTYRVVHTQQWQGLNHLLIFGKLKALHDQWRPQHIVVDATGVGEGLWAMLDKSFPTRVIPVMFNATVKSEIGYRFLAIVETGRFRDCDPSPEADRQYAACQAEVLVGPRRTMRWGVPESARDENGALIHDDIILADALVVELDKLEWTYGSKSLIVPARDPLDEMSKIRDYP
jgi:hypothetical protein